MEPVRRRAQGDLLGFDLSGDSGVAGVLYVVRKAPADGGELASESADMLARLGFVASVLSENISTSRTCRLKNATRLRISSRSASSGNAVGSAGGGAEGAGSAGVKAIGASSARAISARNVSDAGSRTSTCGHAVTNAIRGRTADDNAYPASTSFFGCPERSVSHPDRILRMLLAPSATPSMTPSDIAPAPSTRVRNSGSSG